MKLKINQLMYYQVFNLRYLEQSNLIILEYSIYKSCQYSEIVSLVKLFDNNNCLLATFSTKTKMETGNADMKVRGCQIISGVCTHIIEYKLDH